MLERRAVRPPGVAADGRVDKIGGGNSASRGAPTIAAPGARAEHQALEQRIAGETIRAVHARARDLAGREQAGHRRAAVEIGLDASHQVVRGRPDRKQVAREIEPGFQARRGDHRKAPVHLVGVEMPQAQEDRTRACARDSSTMLRETTSRGARSPAG